MSQNSTQGLAFVLLAVLGWSLSGLFVRLMPELSGWQLNGVRGLFCGLSLYIYLFAKNGAGLVTAITAIPWQGFVASVLCFAMGTTFYLSALSITNTATVSVIGASSPLVTALLSPWLTGERTHPLAWLAALLAAGGLAFISYENLDIGNAAGLALSLCVPLTFALQTLMLRRYRNHDMMAAIGAGGLLSFVISSLVLVSLNLPTVAGLTLREVMLIAAMGLFQLALPLIFYGLSARTLPAVVLSLISMLDAVLNPFWSWLAAGEIPARSAVFGGGIIMLAVLLSIVTTQIQKPKTT